MWNSGISSLFNSSRSNSSSSLYSMFGEYNQIKSGAYKKLLNSYYNDNKSTDKTSSTSSKNKYNSLNKYANELTEVKEAADSVKESSAALVQKGNKGLFGNNYDMDKITDAVKTFVKDYNSLVKASSDTASKSVATNTNSLVRQTKVYESSLNEVGITIGKDNTLSVDEEKLKTAGFDKLKRMFNGNSSFSYITARSANQLAVISAKEATAETYNNNAKYNTAYTMSSFSTYM